MTTDSNAPEAGDRVPHEEYYEMAGGTIPFNLAVDDVETGEPVIRCPRCDEGSPEEEFDWVNTNVYIESVADDGTVLNHDVQSVTLECPNCGKRFSAR